MLFRSRQTSQPLMGRRKYYIELLCITTVHIMLLCNSQCQLCNSRACSAIPMPTVQTWHSRHGSATAFYLCPLGQMVNMVTGEGVLVSIHILENATLKARDRSIGGLSPVADNLLLDWRIIRNSSLRIGIPYLQDR